jgi:2-polyprenyl-6-methoxyphenol hydroxylase-like FAD-dependent oxidoreductase
MAAAMGSHDIGIAGCGIAGLAAALLLARDGHRVTIYERFAQPKPLGSGLLIQPTGLAVLDQVGLAREIVGKGARVRRLFGEDRNGERVLDTRYDDLVQGAFAVGIHRAGLFDTLFAAVGAAGIPLCADHEVAGLADGSGGLRLVFAGGGVSAAHDLVVDCLGCASALAPIGGGWLPFGALWTNLALRTGDPFEPCLLEQRYDRAARMVGLFPTGDRQVALFWSLKAADVERWREAGLAAWKAEVSELWPACESLLERIADPAQLTFARYAHRLIRRPVARRLVRIGDAWHAASPQLGQGANMALLDAWALAKAFRDESDLATALDRFAELRSRHVRLYQWLTWLFTPLYQSDALFPAVLRDIFLAPLSRFGPGPRIQARMVAGLTGNPLAPLDLAMPDYGALAG